MEAGITMLQDGKTPCIVYDEALPHPIDYVEFDRADHCVTLVYKKKVKRGKSKFNAPKEGHKFEFPLDPVYADIMRELGYVGVAMIDKGQISDFKVYTVNFIN